MQKAFLIHCLSPLHAGTGQAVDLIDLPIARYRATRIPFLPGSSIKGVVRDQRTPAAPRPGSREDLDLDPAWSAFLAAFGPDVSEDDASEHAGAVAFGDARLLLLPCRSLRGTFAYVTSPLLLRLACQDLDEAELTDVPAIPEVPAPPETGDDRQVPRALVADQPPSLLLYPPADRKVQSRIFLEDLDFIATGDERTRQWAQWLGERILATRETDMTRRFVVTDDEAMSFLWETATQVDAHNRINERGTVADGQLWYEESLPPETVLLGLASATVSRRAKIARKEPDMLSVAFPYPVDHLQFGGKATTGKGRARLLPIS
jgi:CRISPR-associated protein Cmr4